MPEGPMNFPASGCCDDAPGLLPPAKARRLLLAAAGRLGQTVTLGTDAALGRVLAAAPLAARDLPPFDQSAMDGYGLAAADLRPDAAPRLSRLVVAGEAPGPAVAAGEAVRLMTGAALPQGVAAVVMEEYASEQGGRIHAHRVQQEGDNIRRCGEDVPRGERLAAPGTRLDARHIALFAAAGVAEVTVHRRLRVALLSNGNELGATIHDSNRPMLRALLARPEIAYTDLGVLPDDRAALTRALAKAAATHDLILTTGGVSGSDADHLPAAIIGAGGTVDILKLALKPGKPLAYGRIGTAFCLCLPGNPLAALVTMLVLGRPLLAHLGGATGDGSAPLAAVAGEGFKRKPGREEYVPAQVAGTDAAGLPILVRSGHGGSARLLPLSRADGLLWLPAAAERVAPGEPLRFHPFSTAFGL